MKPRPMNPYNLEKKVENQIFNLELFDPVDIAHVKKEIADAFQRLANMELHNATVEKVTNKRRPKAKK